MIQENIHCMEEKFILTHQNRETKSNKIKHNLERTRAKVTNSLRNK